MYTGQDSRILYKKDVYGAKKIYTKKSLKSYLKGYLFKYDFLLWSKGAIVLWLNAKTIGLRKKFQGSLENNAQSWHKRKVLS